MKHFNLPFTKKDMLSLHAGDEITVSGKVFTARDKAHQYLLKNHLKLIENSAIYHCGPIIRCNEVVSAGPTTSARMNGATPSLIEKYGIRLIIGKGGMDAAVLEALSGRAIYCSAIGGAAVVCAESLKLSGVHKPEFGMPEAIWEFEAENFPLIVTMDAHGKSLYTKIARASENARDKLLRKP